MNIQKMMKEAQKLQARMNPEDVESLEDLVFAALQSALNAAESRAEELMGEVRGELDIPGLDLGQFGL